MKRFILKTMLLSISLLGVLHAQQDTKDHAEATINKAQQDTDSESKWPDDKSTNLCLARRQVNEPLMKP